MAASRLSSPSTGRRRIQPSRPASKAPGWSSDGSAASAELWEQRLVLRQHGWLSPTSPLLLARVLNVLGAQGWYYQQIFRLADQGRADTALGLLQAAWAYLRDELATARRMHRARSR